MDLLRRDPVASALYLPDGAPAKPESFRPLPALTAPLKTLAAEGPRAFYEGALADSIAADPPSGGSRITTAALAASAVGEPAPPPGPHRAPAPPPAPAVSGGPCPPPLCAILGGAPAPPQTAG